MANFLQKVTFKSKANIGKLDLTDQLIPIMTSATTPSGIASASDNLTTFFAWHAFDRGTTPWLVLGTTGWVKYDFGKTVTPKSYTVYGSQSVGLESRALRSWTLEAWNGSGWTVIDTRPNETNWTAFETRAYNIATPTSFSIFRINITANNGDASVLQMTNLQLSDFVI